jgi:(p)ppGpp synthase/HD superfamily hydrolase
VATALFHGLEPSFADGHPLTRAALEFARERHAGQLRDDERAPFLQHPLEVAAVLALAGYPDEVVASGALHDVLESTYTDAGELEDRFGPQVAALVRAVSEDDTIEESEARKSALREQVAGGPLGAAAIFAADKVSKVRELRSRLSCGLPADQAEDKLDHYRASLATVERRLGPRHPLVEQLRVELELLDMLPVG